MLEVEKMRKSSPLKEWKPAIFLVLSLFCVIFLAGCGHGERGTTSAVIPASFDTQLFFRIFGFEPSQRTYAALTSQQGTSSPSAQLSAQREVAETQGSPREGAGLASTPATSLAGPAGGASPLLASLSVASLNAAPRRVCGTVQLLEQETPRLIQKRLQGSFAPRISFSHLPATGPSAAAIGSTRDFVKASLTGTRTDNVAGRLTATLVAKGANIAVYWDGTSTIPLGIPADPPTVTTRYGLGKYIVAAMEVDNPATAAAGDGIYARDRSLFGSELGGPATAAGGNGSGGVDGDPLVIILVTPHLGTLAPSLYGLVDPTDEDATDPTSNQAEMVWVSDLVNGLNIWNDSGDGIRYTGLATIAHEFQHLIDFNQKFFQGGGNIETTSINEGKSLVAEEMNGFSLNNGNAFIQAVVQGFENNSTTGDQGFLENRIGTLPYLLLMYVNDRFGTATLTSIATGSGVGIPNIESKTGTPFGSLFQDWALVNFYDSIAGSPVLPSGNATVRYPSLVMSGNFPSRNDDNTLAGGGLTLPGIQPASTFSAYPTNLAPTSFRPWGVQYVQLSSPSALTNITLFISASSSFNIHAGVFRTTNTIPLTFVSFEGQKP